MLCLTLGNGDCARLYGPDGAVLGTVCVVKTRGSRAVVGFDLDRNVGVIRSARDNRERHDAGMGDRGSVDAGDRAAAD
jgi:hypothetical protein